MWQIIIIFCLILSCKQDKTTVIERQIGGNNNPPGRTAIQFPRPDGFPPVRTRDQTFLGFDNIEQFQLADVQSLDQAVRLNTRWLILSDKFDEGASPSLMDAYRGGLNKALNSISIERDVTVSQPIDGAGSIMRIDLRDFGLTRQKWNLIEDNDPLGIKSKTQRGALVRILTGTSKPFMHAHNFINIAMNNEVYYNLVGAPIKLVDFLRFSDVNDQADFDEFDEDLFLVGISNSQIALQKTRLFQRNDSRFGPFWRTFDTVLGAFDPAKNVFDFPFPKEARSQKIFNEDAQEFIWEMENGCHGYALYNAQGVRENFAPTNIVFNPNSGGLDPTIRNALSCVMCHAQGFIVAEDQVNDKVQTDPNFNAVDRDRAQRYHGRRAALAASFREDNNKYADRCLSAISVSPANPDPINNLVDTIRLEMNIVQVASLLWLRESEFRDGLNSSIQGKAQIGQLLNGGSISFEQLVLTLPVLEEDLRLFQDPLGQ